MKTRIISGAVLIAVFTALLILGGSVLLVALFLLTIIGLYEFYNVIQHSKQHKPFRITGMIASFLLYLCLLLLKEQIWNSHFMMLYFTVLLIVLMVLCIVCYPKRSVTDAALTFLEWPM